MTEVGNRREFPDASSNALLCGTPNWNISAQHATFLGQKNGLGAEKADESLGHSGAAPTRERERERAAKSWKDVDLARGIAVPDVPARRAEVSRRQH